MEKCQRIAETPCGVFLVPVDIVSGHVSPEMNRELLSAIPKEYLGCLFRGVSIDRLSTVLGHGIDVEPTNAVIWVNSLDKALEYGGWPKLMMALDFKFLRRSFVELDANTSEAELSSVRRDYPRVVKDGAKLFCSRLREDEPQFNTSYEWDSAWWIPDDPWKALKGVFILFRPNVLSDIEILRGQPVQKA